MADATKPNNEDTNVVEANTTNNVNNESNANSNAIEAVSTADTNDSATVTTTTTTPVAAAVKESEKEPETATAIATTKTTTTNTTGVGDIDVEAAKTKRDTVTVESEMSKNMPKNTVENASMPIVANSENNGNISKISKPTTTTTTTTMATEKPTATKTLPQLLPAKQQERQTIGGGDAAMQADENPNNKGKMENDSGPINFRVLYILTQLCGITMVILVGIWLGVHMGGFAGTSNPSLEFNWHPLLMTIGLIFLYGNSILVYRGFRTTSKKTLKITHASVHMGAFILTVIALKAVFDSHNLAAKPIPNMYSLHSWLGLSAVLIFCMQYVAGFMAYMVPGLREQYKIAYMPLHIYFGLFGFVLAIASALMGFTEKAFFSISGYSSLPKSGVIMNVCGVLFVIFGALVVYLTTEPSYKRKPLPEDAVLLTGANE